MFSLIRINWPHTLAEKEAVTFLILSTANKFFRLFCTVRTFANFSMILSFLKSRPCQKQKIAKIANLIFPRNGEAGETSVILISYYAISPMYSTTTQISTIFVAHSRKSATQYSLAPKYRVSQLDIGTVHRFNYDIRRIKSILSDTRVRKKKGANSIPLKIKHNTLCSTS